MRILMEINERPSFETRYIIRSVVCALKSLFKSAV